MTDVSDQTWSVPSRLGTTISVVDGELRGHLKPTAPTCVHGAVRPSVVAFLVDATAGLQIDTDPDTWSFTSDLSVRLPAVPAPARLDARVVPLRSGRRSAVADVALTDDEGRPFGHATIGFARVDRRAGDPPKPDIDLLEAAAWWAQIPVIDRPLREVAGIEVLDRSTGAVELTLRPDLLNPAGALQGAMVALVAEASAEELAAAHGRAAPVVTDLDVRFLRQARGRAVGSRARPVDADGACHVELFDPDAPDAVLASVLARTVTGPRPGHT